MNILAIDSSGLVATVALLCDDILTAEYTIHNKRTHSQTLLPMIDEMLIMADFDKKNIDAIAVAEGPGSFTGLRIGASTAKGMAMAYDIPIVPVSTLEGLSFSMMGSSYVICPIMDARCMQVYRGIYDVSEDVPVSLVTQAAVPIEDVIRELDDIKRDVCFIGDGVPVYKEKLKKELKVAHIFGNDAIRYQRASSVAVLAKSLFMRGKVVKAAEFAPEYLRASQAERQRANG